VHQVRLTTFGKLSISHNGVALNALSSSSVQLFAFLALLRGESIEPCELARRLYPQQSNGESLESLRDAQESLWRGFPLAVRLFQGISVEEANRLKSGLRLVAVPGIVALDVDALQLESRLTANWAEMPRAEAAERLTEAADVMDREFLVGVSGDWGLDVGERLCRLFRAATVATLAADLSERTVRLSPPQSSDETTMPLGRFFGRRSERELMSTYLDQDELTLTLVGLGGVGKSRLALEFLRELPPSWRGVSVYPVSLASVVTKVGVLEAILESLGKRVGGAFLQGRDTLVTVLQALQDRSVLFLDNVEDAALEPGGEVVQLLSYLRYRCPKLAILSTSRCRIGIPGELVIPVTAFELPSTEALGDTEASSLLERFPGLEMVLDALDGACKAGAALRDDPSRLAELLRATGGLPLAIEMLAARAAVARRLPSLEEATAGELSPARSIEWALSAVSVEATDLFYSVSIFCDTFTAEAVEGITGRANVGFSLSELDDVALIHAVPGDGFLRFRCPPAFVIGRGRDFRCEKRCRITSRLMRSTSPLC
jgi:hypothetical protein